MVSIAAVCGVASWSLVVLGLTFLASEIALLVIICTLPAFRKYVQDHLDYLAKEKAKEVRIATLNCLRVEDKTKFLQLEASVDKWQASFRQFKSMAPIGTLVECQRLLKIYLALALEHARIRGTDTNSIGNLEFRLKHLRCEQETTPSQALQDRITTVEKHLKLLDNSSDRYVEIWHQMEGTAEYINYVIDHTSVYSNNSRMRIATDKTISTDLAVEQETIEEMQEFLSIEEVDIDMDAILLGK